MTAPTAYSIRGYGEMIRDQPRMAGYVEALRHAIRPGCIVLDIGSGTGIFSLLACQFGAGRVHAVEPDAAAMDVARRMAADNGCTDRITFHQAVSTRVELPVRADVVISDLRGVLPMFQQHLPAIIDARERLLAPGGSMIPRRDSLWAAIIEDEEAYESCRRPWLSNDLGLDLRAGHPMAVNSWRRIHASANRLLSEPQQWGVLDYMTVSQPQLGGRAHWLAQRRGRAHGLLLWFDAELGDGIGFSNAPAQVELIYGQAFFPLEQPVPLGPGDTVTCDLHAALVGGDYVWTWNTRVMAADPSANASFRQSTFFAEPLSASRLRRRVPGFVPGLTRAAEIDRLVLSLLGGAATIGDIAAELQSRFPQAFARFEDALGHVADLTERYGESQ